MDRLPNLLYAARRTPQLLLLLAAVLAAGLLTAACSSDPTPTPAPMPDAQSTSAASTTTETARAELFAPGSISVNASQGIHASGYGAASGSPDIAVLSLGVEAVRPTVREARDDAANALDAIVGELRDAGVGDDDIHTTQFSIHPRYEYFDNRQHLTGFEVSNTLSVTLRDLDAAGAVVDRAIAAGGDLTRLYDISFRIENTEPLERQARISAIQDAVDKADLYAEQLNVSRGALISVSESSVDPYAVADVRFDGFAMAESAAAPTQFFAGEFEVSVRVQVVFGIQ